MARGWGACCLVSMPNPQDRSTTVATPLGRMQVDLVFMDYVPNMSAELEMVKKSLYLEKLIRALMEHGGNPAVVAIEVRAGALGAASWYCW